MIHSNQHPLSAASMMPSMPSPPANLSAENFRSAEQANRGGEAFSLQSPLEQATEQNQSPDELREKFTEFVGQTFFGSVLSSMRRTVGKPAYMHGGRGEEVFQKQLDDQMVQELTKSSADQFADPMFDLFQMQRQP